MIDVKELRIGNWVSTKYHQGPIENGSDLEFVDKLFPIPLTPEVLERCGFALQPFKQSIYNKGMVRVWMGHNGVIAYLIEKGETNAHYIRDLQSLHQLQNLYFALTGQELNYTP